MEQICLYRRPCLEERGSRLTFPRNQVCESDEDVSVVVYLEVIPGHTGKGVYKGDGEEQDANTEGITEPITSVSICSQYPPATEFFQQV